MASQYENAARVGWEFMRKGNRKIKDFHALPDDMRNSLITQAELIHRAAGATDQEVRVMILELAKEGW